MISIDPEADRVEHRERADQRHRDRDGGDQRGTPILEEHVDDQEHEGDRHEQRGHHLGDRLGNELRGVVADHLLDPGREALRQTRELRAHATRHLERVGLGELEHAERGGGLAGEARESGIALRAELDARHVSEMQQRPARLGADHDLLELLDRGEAPLRSQRNLELNAGGRRRRSGAARGDLHVLLAHRVDHVGRREPERGEPLGIEPDAHRIAPLAEDVDVADAGHALERIEHVDQREVGEEERVARAVRREQIGHQRELGRLLAHGDAEPANLLGQARQGDRDAVVHVDGGQIGVAPELERDEHAHLAVVRARRRQIEHALGAVHLLFDRQRDRALHHVRGGARVAGRDEDGGRRDRRELRDLQLRKRDRADQRDQDRDDGCEDRPVDEERDEAGRAGAIGGARGRGQRGSLLGADGAHFPTPAAR